MHPTQDEVDAEVAVRLQREPASIGSLIEEMCIGPSEMQVRRAAWKVLYDQGADLDQELRIVVKL